MHFYYYLIISPRKRAEPFIWTNLIPLHPRMFGASGSGEEDFKNLSKYFRKFVIISPWKRAGPFNWTNLNPLHPRMNYAKFCWNWSSGFGEDFYNLSLYFGYFVIISPWKKAEPFIWTNLNSLHQKRFVPSLVEIDPVVLEKKIFKICQCIFAFS